MKGTRESLAQAVEKARERNQERLGHMYRDGDRYFFLIGRRVPNSHLVSPFFWMTVRSMDEYFCDDCEVALDWLVAELEGWETRGLIMPPVSQLWFCDDKPERKKEQKRDTCKMNYITKKTELPNCHDCKVEPGQPHRVGCDTEQCSSCGGQKICCDCTDHDPAFARWTGIWPGKAEADFLGIDLNRLVLSGLHMLFFIKPKV